MVLNGVESACFGVNVCLRGYSWQVAAVEENCTVKYNNICTLPVRVHRGRRARRTRDCAVGVLRVEFIYRCKVAVQNYLQ